MVDQKSKTTAYGADQIQVLEGLSAVRRRPGMYIGTTDVAGLHHLVWEAVDNAIDEAMAGHCKNIDVLIQKDGGLTVIDDGRGIPVETHKKTKKSALETVMTMLHAGAKFGEGGYKVSGGLHGVGISVVNALSIKLVVDVCRDDHVYRQEYKRGVPQTEVEKIGKSDKTGTKVLFYPDEEIFKIREFDYLTILNRMRQQAYLTKGVTINIVDERADKKYRFYFEGGIGSYVRHLNQNKETLSEIIHIEKEAPEGLIDVALQYTQTFNEHVSTFANTIFTSEGGMHLTGFRSALTRTLNNYARKNDLLKEKDENLTSDDVREGLTAIVSVKIPSPQFEGQTKSKLGNAEIRTAVETVFGDAFEIYLDEHPSEGRAILGKCILAVRARLAARAARDSVLRKGLLEGMMLPGKLADCTSKDSKNSELFIVEGDSAGGCLAGDTKIALADGRNIAFKELIREYQEGKKNYCYTIGKNGEINIALIENPRKTKKNAEVVKIILDNNEKIVCTSDHKFMLRDGSYKEAKNLTSNDSLMPLYRKYSEIGGRITIEGYEMVLSPKIHKWIFTHLFSDKYNIENDIYSKENSDIVHHIDFNKLNNNPDNLIKMSKKDHLLLHARILEKTLHREDVKEKCRKNHQTKEFRAKIKEIMIRPEMRKMLSERAKKQWSNDEYKRYMVKKFLEFYNNNAGYREKNKKLLLEVQQKYWSDGKNKKKQAEKVREYFRNNPDQRKWLSDLAKKQWQNLDLLNWRSEKTKEQWTAAFRKIRRTAYNQTYLKKALAVLHDIYKKSHKIDKAVYNKIRKLTKDKNLIRYETIRDRFFNGNEAEFKEAILDYNHHVKDIILLKRKIDVYDLEVSETHNFALSSGIFVHNSAKQGRNREFQAILPLRGKILNVEQARMDKMLQNAEIKALVIALGVGIAESFDVSKLRYDRVVIMTDADVDGAHIRTLLLTMFYRYFKPIIETGHLYIAQPPLYKIASGKSVQYVYSDVEKEQVLTGFGAQKVSMQRYKGLGEMNPEQLWETTMDPARRTMHQVTIADAERADMVFDTLMGSEVMPRKKFIQAHAKKVRNLDI
ncbi:DNA topoisomerase (ATP-hydrolyzing) subunit B [Candidatus Peregrinibacteria bacterium]|nr:DNA topoisomerase (ATP-hydrolyzing) subunit B [Candidatus Peregrinibacteria bacterium]